LRFCFPTHTQDQSHHMKALSLLLTIVLLGLICTAKAQVSIVDEVSHALNERDGEYIKMVAKIPELHGANFMSVRRGVPRQMRFRQVTTQQLSALANALLNLVDGAADSVLVEDETRAKLFWEEGTKCVVVLQHRHAGIAVVGSYVVIKINNDDTGELSNALISVSSSKSAGLSLSEAVAIAKHAGLREKGKDLDESELGEVSQDKVYVQASDGTAHLAYYVRVFSKSARKPSRLYVDAETGGVIDVVRTRYFLDSAPDDISWIPGPWQWIGVGVEDQQVVCDSKPWKRPTFYYPGPPYWLNSPKSQLNVYGPAERMRSPEIGLTSIRWESSPADLDQALPFWTWNDFAERIFQDNTNCDSPAYDAVFSLPWPAYKNVPFTSAEIDQYQELQTAIEDIRARFDWSGLDNEFNPLILVQDVQEKGEYSCATDLVANSYKFKMIYCPIDITQAQFGLPQRTPPVETLAHEFAHTIIHDKGLSLTSWEGMILTEGLADMFGVAVKSKHSPNPWLLGDQLGYMERVKEWRCMYDGAAYCNAPPTVGLRDIAHPKTMDLVKPSPNYYYSPNYDPSDWNRASQIVTYMLYLLSEGAFDGARDDNPNLGVFQAFAGIGFESMLEVFSKSLDGLPQVQIQNGFPLQEYAAQLELAGAHECGSWSSEELVAKKAAWIVNLALSDVDFSKDSGYISPKWDQPDVSPLTKFQFDGEANERYDFQISTDVFLKSGNVFGQVVADGSGKGQFLVKLEPNQFYWWRVRKWNAPMLGSSFVDKAQACWRPVSRFRTGDPAVVSSPQPQEGEVVEPWLGQFSWAKGDWAGFELWVDDVEPSLPRYTKVWAHRLMAAKDLQVVNESPDPKALILKPGQLPLPMNHDLCWKLVGFQFDQDGKRVDGDPVEKCFHTKEPVTLVTNPPPPGMGGKLPSVPAQPLLIDYDPADGSDHHDFSLEVLKLAGANAPDPVGAWAYLDDPAHDDKNTVKEPVSVQNWTSRSRKRMLPVQIDTGASLNYGLDVVRLTLTSFSPAISSPLNGGTYPEKYEQAAKNFVDFHPVDPNNATLHSFVTAPPASQSCSSSQNTGLKLAWTPGIGATPEAVPMYQIKLFPEHCGNRQGGCVPFVDPDSEEFTESLFLTKEVKNIGQPLQYVFSRSELFPDEASEMNSVTGFKVLLSGVSGEEPGPAGLNITATFETDLPVMPATLDAYVHFESNPDHPEGAHFLATSLLNKNSANPLRTDTYNDSYNHVVVRAFKGPECSDANIIDSNESTPSDSALFIDPDSAELQDDSHPVISAQAELSWSGMTCPVLHSACVTEHGSNPKAKPDPVTGLNPREENGVLGASWDPPISDANPASIEYRIAVYAGGNDPSNLLVHNPGLPGELPIPTAIALPSTTPFGSQIGISFLAPLEASDVGKNVVLSIQSCRQATNKCSVEAIQPYQIGSAINNNAGPPNPPQDVALHFSDPLLQQLFQDAFGFDPGSLALYTYVSWNPSPSGTAPTYYLTTFASDGQVPGVLPTVFNQLNLDGANYLGDASAYWGIVRASDVGSVFSATAWARYVWPLAATYYLAEPPASGVLMITSVRACSGIVPLPVNKKYDWLVAANVETCSAPVTASQLYP
jgi:hypothetical protein